MHGDLRHDFAKMRAFVCDASADQHEVLRNRPSGQFAHAPLKADCRNMVLAAAVRAAADLDVARRNRVNEFGMRVQVLGEQLDLILATGSRRDGRSPRPGSSSRRQSCPHPALRARRRRAARRSLGPPDAGTQRKSTF